MKKITLGILLFASVSGISYGVHAGLKNSDERKEASKGSDAPIWQNFTLDDIDWPEWQMPEVRWPEWQMPEVRWPDWTMPEISWPEWQMPELEMPEIRLPEWEMPKWEIPEITWPAITLPEMPEIKMPEWNMPELPTFEMPEISFPEITLPKPDVSGFYRDNIHAPIGGFFSDTGRFFNDKALRVHYAYHGTIYNLRTPAFTPELIEDTPDKNMSVAKADNTSLLFASLEPASGTEGDEVGASIESETEASTTIAQNDTGSDEIQLSEDAPELLETLPERYDFEEQVLETDAILIPRQNIVVSSTRSGKISKIPFKNGDLIKKGDVLVEYECAPLRAELDSMKERASMSEIKSTSAEKLFKLEMISNIEHIDLLAEQNDIAARLNVLRAQMQDCIVHSEFDGHVTNRLANPHEYTRTDRVLMEIASNEAMNAKILVPSLWLRWLNVGAPIEILVSETGRTYEAEITRVYGEVDPASQSIQMEASLKPYQDRLLPGMSGMAVIDLQKIRDAGVYGFLEEPVPMMDDMPPAPEPAEKEE